MAKISGLWRQKWKWQNLTKLNKDIKFYGIYIGNTDRMSENNEIVDKLTYLIKTTILKLVRKNLSGNKLRINQQE